MKQFSYAVDERNHVIAAARLFVRRLAPGRLVCFIRNKLLFPAAWRRNQVIAAARLVVLVEGLTFLRIEN